MTDHRLAYIEHVSQLLIYKFQKVQHLTVDAHHELEAIQSYLKELSRVYDHWVREQR